MVDQQERFKTFWGSQQGFLLGPISLILLIMFFCRRLTMRAPSSLEPISAAGAVEPSVTTRSHFRDIPNIVWQRFKTMP